MLLVPIFVICFFWRFPAHYLVSLVIFVIASVTDAIDGKLARSRNEITDFGKFLDPLADKVLVISAMACFLQQQRMHIAAFLLIVTREFMVSALRLVAGKLKTAFTMVAIITALVWWSFQGDFKAFGLDLPYALYTGCEVLIQILFWIAAVLTVWSGIEYLKAYWKDINPNK